jgi:arylsulfatase
VHWPAKLSEKQNTINRGVAHVIDVLPTCLALSGAKYPDNFNGQTALKPSGKNLLPLIFGETESVHDTLYWEHEGGRAIRIGDWKVTSLPKQDWELFDLSTDHTETLNLAAKYPEKVSEMNAAWEKWVAQTEIK